MAGETGADREALLREAGFDSAEIERLAAAGAYGCAGKFQQDHQPRIHLPYRKEEPWENMT